LFSLLVQVTELSQPVTEISCVSQHQNSSLVLISPQVLRSVLAGATESCHHCFTLLQDDKPILQGCWSPGDGCNEECIMKSLHSYEEKTSSLKFCCCSTKICNLEWREEDTSEQSSSQVNVIEKLELSFLNVDYFSVLVATTSLSLTLVLFSFIIVIFMYKDRFQKHKILDKFYTDKVGLISNKI